MLVVRSYIILISLKIFHITATPEGALKHAFYNVCKRKSDYNFKIYRKHKNISQKKKMI